METECSDPPEESCSDAGCPVHADWSADEDEEFNHDEWTALREAREGQEL